MAERDRHDAFLAVVGHSDVSEVVLDGVVVGAHHDLGPVLGGGVEELGLQVPVAEGVCHDAHLVDGPRCDHQDVGGQHGHHDHVGFGHVQDVAVAEVAGTGRAAGCRFPCRGPW